MVRHGYRARAGNGHTGGGRFSIADDFRNWFLRIMRSLFASAPGSARASRADCGASPQSRFWDNQRRACPTEKFAMAGAPSPAREARALPGICRRVIARFAIFLSVLALLGCETTNYVPPVTPQMASANSQRQDVDPSTSLRTSLAKLESGRTLL